MRLTSRILPRLFIYLLSLIGNSTVQATPLATASATVTLNITVTQPSCTLTMPETVSLGGMLQGIRSYAPLFIDIRCGSGSGVTSALYAEIVQGFPTAGYVDRINMIAPADSSGTAAQLWLKTVDGNSVVMDPNGSSNMDSQFCRGSTDRQCTLIPYTQIAADTPRGITSAVVRVSVTYP